MKQLLRISVFLAFLSTAADVTGTATIGLYFEGSPGQMIYSPRIYEQFKMYVYLHNAEALVTGVEYSIARGGPHSGPCPFLIMDYRFAQDALTLGLPDQSVAAVFWPPLDGFAGHNLICEYTCLAIGDCGDDGGPVWNYPVRIEPHEDTGQLRGTYYPNNDFFPIIGLTSILCPGGCLGMGCVGTEKATWGSIKSLYR